MPNVRLRPRSGGLGERLGYRLDRFLSMHPAVQLAAVLVSATVLALILGAASLLYAEDPAVGVFDGFWWAITHMLDGGTIGADHGIFRRFVGVGVTLVGMVLVAVVTGAFASSFGDRLREIRRGTFAVFERRHLLLLGYGARADILFRELGASGLRTTVVIVSAKDRDVVEERVRESLAGTRHRLKVIVRRADPGTTAGVSGASATRARAIVILPEVDAQNVLAGPAGSNHTPEDRAAMRSMLAARRVVGTRRIPVIVEVADERGRALIDLCTKPADLTLVEEGDLTAHLLVHAVRQPGVLDVIRQILSLDARSVYIHAAGPFAGMTFDQAHAKLSPGILIGLLRRRATLLSPPGDTHVESADRLLVFADDSTEPTPSDKLPPFERSAPAPSMRPACGPVHVLVVGYRHGFGKILRSMRTHFVAQVTLLVPPEHLASARAALECAGFPAGHATLLEGHPTDPATLACATASGATRILLLAGDVTSGPPTELDAAQLIALLQIRKLLPGDGMEPPAVVEVHSAETERLVGSNRATDFVLLREITGMLLGQELHAICLDETAGAWLGEVFRALLDDICMRVWLRPVATYVPSATEPTFADLLAAARSHGETAIGVRRRGRAELLPPRTARFDPRDTEVVVIAAPETLPHPHASREKAHATRSHETESVS